jgi:hypothetical protein
MGSIIMPLPTTIAPRVDAINTSRVSAGRFALFRVLKFRVSAAHAVFCSGFDSRQLHR